MTRVQANLLLLLTGAIWGMGFVAQSSAMSAVGPWTFTAARFLLATLTLLPFAIWEGRRSAAAMPKRTWGGFVLCGTALFVGSTLQQIGLLTTTVTNAGFITGLYVVMTPALAWLVLRARPHWVIWPGSIAALAGIFLTGGGQLGAIVAGDWLTLGAAACFAVQITGVGIFAATSGRPFTLSFVQFAVTAAAALPGAVVLEPIDFPALFAVWPHVAYAGVVSAGVAFTLQTVGQRWTTAPQAAIFLSSEAVFAALFGALFLGERIPPVGYAGCALIFAAMLAVEVAPLRWPARATLLAKENAAARGETVGG